MVPSKRRQTVRPSGLIVKAASVVILGAAFLASTPLSAEEIKVVCPNPLPKTPELSRADVYKDVPFKAGETATYEVTWAGIKAGYGTLDVRAPIKHKGVWHRVFHASASTGDWFRTIFVAKEEAEAFSRPWDFGVSYFYMEQNEGKLLSKPFAQKKWLDFDHDKCVVHEKTQKPDAPEKKDSFDLAYGSIDALGVVHALRLRDFKVGRKERAPVYTSEKNWWLEADPLGIEEVTVPAGKFKAMKLKLQTFIGKEMQQKGDVWAWYAVDTPSRQLVQLQGEIKIGNIWIKLHQFKPGT